MAQPEHDTNTQIYSLQTGEVLQVRDISTLSQLDGLMTLILQGCTQISDVTPLGRLVGLQTLDVSQFQNFVHFGFESFM